MESFFVLVECWTTNVSIDRKRPLINSLIAPRSILSMDYYSFFLSSQSDTLLAHFSIAHRHPTHKMFAQFTAFLLPHSHSIGRVLVQVQVQAVDAAVAVPHEYFPFKGGDPVSWRAWATKVTRDHHKRLRDGGSHATYTSIEVVGSRRLSPAISANALWERPLGPRIMWSLWRTAFLLLCTWFWSVFRVGPMPPRLPPLRLWPMPNPGRWCWFPSRLVSTHQRSTRTLVLRFLFSRLQSRKGRARPRRGAKAPRGPLKAPRVGRKVMARVSSGCTIRRAGPG